MRYFDRAWASATCLRCRRSIQRFCGWVRLGVIEGAGESELEVVLEPRHAARPRLVAYLRAVRARKVGDIDVSQPVDVGVSVFDGPDERLHPIAGGAGEPETGDDDRRPGPAERWTRLAHEEERTPWTRTFLNGVRAPMSWMRVSNPSFAIRRAQSSALR